MLRRSFVLALSLLLPYAPAAMAGDEENDELPELTASPLVSTPRPDPEGQPRPGESQDDVDRRLGPWLDLRNGGFAVGNPQGKEGGYGSLERGSLLPAKGDGFLRLGGEGGDYGTGFMISLLENSAGEFARTHAGELLRVGAIAQVNGGHFPPHKSHQNGLDADLLFMGTKNFDSVLDKDGKVSDRFLPELNWSYWRQITAQRFVKGGKVESIVSMILVAPELKAFLCGWAKEKDLLRDPLNVEVLKRLHPTAGHDTHFHLRLQCSPYHPQCTKTFGPPTELGCP